MKSERRHELKESDLVHVLDETRDFVRNHGARIGIGAIIVIGVTVISWLMIRQRQAAEEDLWRNKSLLAFTTPAEAKDSLRSLMKMASESNDGDFARQALIDQGAKALGMANDGDVIPDKELNDLARQAYEELLARFGKSPLVAGVAHLGLATVAENDFALDDDPKHKEEAGAHLDKIIDNAALQALPVYQLALDRRTALDDTLVKVVFAPRPPPPPAPVELTGPPSPAPAPVSVVPVPAEPASAKPATGTPAPITINPGGDDDPGGPVLTPINPQRVPEAVREALRRRQEEQRKKAEEKKSQGESPKSQDPPKEPDADKANSPPADPLP